MCSEYVSVVGSGLSWTSSWSQHVQRSSLFRESSVWLWTFLLKWTYVTVYPSSPQLSILLFLVLTQHAVICHSRLHRFQWFYTSSFTPEYRNSLSGVTALLCPHPLPSTPVTRHLLSGQLRASLLSTLSNAIIPWLGSLLWTQQDLGACCFSVTSPSFQPFKHVQNLMQDCYFFTHPSNFTNICWA